MCCQPSSSVPSEAPSCPCEKNAENTGDDGENADNESNFVLFGKCSRNDFRSHCCYYILACLLLCYIWGEGYGWGREIDADNN